MGPVFLFDVSIVIFVVSSGASKLDGGFPLGEMSEQVVIEELAAIVAIKAEQGEGQSVFDVFDLLEDVGFSFSPDGSLFGPAGGNIDTVNAVDEHPGQGLAAMGDSIGFKKTWA